MEDSKKMIVRATKEQLKEFMNSILWKDIKRELGQWKTMCRYEYGQVVSDTIDSEGITTAKVLMHLGDIRGREMAIDYLLSLPTIFLQTLEEKKDDSRHKSTD